MSLLACFMKVKTTTLVSKYHSVCETSTEGRDSNLYITRRSFTTRLKILLKPVLHIINLKKKKKMKSFLRNRSHSKASSATSRGITSSTTYLEPTASTPTEWWLARENAFDTAARVYKKLYRPDSDLSYYSREQDYDEFEEEEKALMPLSPSSPEWNASRWFWSDERAEMWVEHVASSEWSHISVNDNGSGSVDAKSIAASGTEARGDADEQTVIADDNSQDEQKEPENSQESKAEVKSIAGELPRRPKLTIQIPSGTPDYYANHGPNDYSSCRPHITSEERAEWKKNMF